MNSTIRFGRLSKTRMNRKKLRNFVRSHEVNKAIEPRLLLRKISTNVDRQRGAGSGRRGAAKRRREPSKLNCSVWMNMLNDPNIRDIESRAGQDFRRRFRIPFTFYDFLVRQFRDHNLFQNVIKTQIPVEIKILVGLRMLARGLTADDIPEMTGIGSSTAQAIFKSFCSAMCSHFSNEFMPNPKPENMQDSQAVYQKMGLPGCVGSIDCTHFEWRKCPTSLQNLCHGKEGYPTLSFQVVVDHGRRIRWLSTPFYGSTNDKGISHEDAFIRRMRNGLFSEMEFKMYNDNNIVVHYKGGYLICDGGYPKEPIFQCPPSHSWEREPVLFAEWIESIRKDIECTFGILKQRFRYLLRGFELHDMQDIHAVVRTCCLLHNMLLLYNQHDISQWEDCRWENVTNDWDAYEFQEFEDEQIEEEVLNQRREDEEAEEDRHLTLEELLPSGNESVLVVNKMNFYTLQKALQRNFARQFRFGRLCWPKQMRKERRTLMNMPGVPLTPQAIIRAINSSQISHLYISESMYYVRNPRRSIGKGLFTRIDLKPGQFICRYIGEVVTLEEMERREADGKGGYCHCIRSRESERFDCYPFLDICKASMANDYRRIFKKNTNRRAVQNARIYFMVNGFPAIKVLDANDGGQIIPMGSEILVYYGEEYVFPMDIT